MASAVLRLLLWAAVMTSRAVAFSTHTGMLTASSSAFMYSSMLHTCYNNYSQPTQGANFRSFLDSKHAWLRLHNVLWSTKEPCKAAAAPETADSQGSSSSQAEHSDQDPCALTVITTLTLSRMDGLEHLCRSWPGPLVASLYIPLDQPTGETSLTANSTEELQKALEAATELFNRMEAEPDSCALRILLMSEVLQEELMLLLLPINSLRNAAMLAARTPLIAMIDVDLLISASLGFNLVRGPELIRKDRSDELVRACLNDTVFVLPALEPRVNRSEGRTDAQLLEWADQSVTGDKHDLLAMIRQQQMCYFQELNYPRGHRLTDFSRWYTAVWPYQIKWQMFFEPWFIAPRWGVPWYDVRFQGYGYNKQNHVAAVSGSGMRFMVHPDAFVVHRPHNRTAVQRMYVVALNTRAKLSKAGQRVQLVTNFTRSDELTVGQAGALLQDHVNAMFHRNVRDMKEGTYVPQLDVATQQCLRSLPWWGCDASPVLNKHCGVWRVAAP